MMAPREEIPIWAVFPMVFGAFVCLGICILGPMFIVFEFAGHIKDFGWPGWLTPIASAPAIIALWAVFGTAASFLFKELFS